VVKKAEYMHYYQFHIGDYKSHTHHLSLLEDLAYRRLLDFYFLHEKPIKHRDVARQIGMREHEEDVMTVLNEFFISTEDGFVSPRADKEIKQYKEFAEAGKRGAAKRWGTPPNGEAISPPNATPIATINQEPITTNHKPKREIATVVACPPDVSQQIWNDWVALRKSKKAPITQTVLNGAIAEAKILGWPLEKFLAEWCSRGSQGLKADWIVKPNPADKVRLTVAPSNEPDPALLKIDEDRKKAVPIPLAVLEKMAELRRKA
jgi:uncharacterized protein YdaU (DUF1376 family)